MAPILQIGDLGVERLRHTAELAFVAAGLPSEPRRSVSRACVLNHYANLPLM